MKTNTLIKYLAAVLTVALSPFAQATQPEVPGVAEQPDSFFYTGKPYDADLGAYTFAARNYDPQVNRWTSADPSGFPDGANNSVYIGNKALYFLDPSGLTGKSIIWIYAYAGMPDEAEDWASPLQGAFNDLKAELIRLDNESPSPRYLNDNDVFNWGTVSTLEGLGNFDDYKRVVLVVHGKNFDGRPSWNIGLGDTSGWENEEERRYSTAEIHEARGINRYMEIYGCGWTAEGTTPSAAILAITKSVKDYLSE